MMNETPMPEIVKNYILASNEHNVEAYLNTFADQAVIEELSIGKSLAGREAIKHYFLTYFVDMNTHTDIQHVNVQDDVIDMKVWFTGDFADKAITGLYRFILKDGRIATLRADLE